MTRIILVPGLRGATPDHWQERLAGPGDPCHHLPTTRGALDLAGRIADLDAAVGAAGRSEEVVVVAHSAGCLVLAHWARTSHRPLRSALFVTPPALHEELPASYPRSADLAAAGYLPWPRSVMPFRSTVAVSDDDPLGPVPEVLALAEAWGASVLRLGAVGHANPASGLGPWPLMREVVEALAA